MLNEEPSDLIKNIGILAALRSASEAEPIRAAQPTKQRNPKRTKIDTDGAADPPSVPSPGIAPALNKLKGRDVMRSVSVPRQQPEPAIKVEEGAEATKSPATEKATKLFVGAEVAYKLTKPKEDAQWIQCNIMGITGDGNKRRCVNPIEVAELVTERRHEGMRCKIRSQMTMVIQDQSTRRLLQH